MTTSLLQYPKDLAYTHEHIWIRTLNGLIEVGISDFAQDQLTEVAFVELPAVGRHFDAGQIFGTVESVKSVNDLYSPYSGMVVESNPELEDAPTLINTDPYGKGWLIRFCCDTPSASVALLDAQAYKNFLESA